MLTGYMSMYSYRRGASTVVNHFDAPPALLFLKLILYASTANGKVFILVVWEGHHLAAPH